MYVCVLYLCLVPSKVRGAVSHYVGMETWTQLFCNHSVLFNHWAVCLTHSGRKCQIHYFYQSYLPPYLHMYPSLCIWWIKIVLGSSYKPCIWPKRGCPTLLMMSAQATLRRLTGPAWFHQWQKSQDLSNHFLALEKGPDLRTLSICKTSKRWKNIQSGRCQWTCQRADHRISWNPSNFSSQNL